MSLVEVLVTLAITALASVLIVTTARPADALKSETEQLSQTLAQLESRARVSGRPTALMLDKTGYASAEWQGTEWTVAEKTRHTFGRGVAAKLPDMQATRKDKAALAPFVIFDPLGHSTTAPVQLSDKTRQMNVSARIPPVPE